MDRAMAKLEEVLHGPEPEQPPPKPFGFGEFSPNVPPTPADDMYLQPGGGWGSHAEDAREAQRQQVELQAAEARRRARDSDLDPMHQRMADLERRVIELERRLPEPEGES